MAENIINLFDCQPWTPDNRCRQIFEGIASLQILLTIIAFILNSLTISSYNRRKALRKKIPNLLLMNQAVADLFNAVVFGGSQITMLIFSMSTSLWDPQWRDKWVIIVLITRIVSYPLTLFSSLLLYLIIAVERFLAICFPLWHRVHAQRKHVWISVAIIWCVSTLMATCRSLYGLYASTSRGPIPNGVIEMVPIVYQIFKISFITLLTIITLLFIITFLKAFIGLLQVNHHSPQTPLDPPHTQESKSR